MAQMQAIEFVEALVALFASNDFNGGWNGVGKISHDNPRLLQSVTRLLFITGNLDFAPS
jgi:hypothetical protein